MPPGTPGIPPALLTPDEKSVHANGSGSLSAFVSASSAGCSEWAGTCDSSSPSSYWTLKVASPMLTDEIRPRHHVPLGGEGNGGELEGKRAGEARGLETSFLLKF